MSINTFRVGRIIIYPHLSWNKETTYDEFVEIGNKLKEKLNNIIIWGDTEYTYETNGKWNITLSLQINDVNYMYLIRNDSKLKQTFGCPFYNIEYKDPPLLNVNLDKNKETIFKKFEDTLIEIIGIGEYINSFKTK